MSFADLSRRLAKLAVDNSPTILTTIGVVGTVTTAYLAGKASFEAADIVRLNEVNDEITHAGNHIRGEHVLDSRDLAMDRFKSVWKLYIPTVLIGAASITCIIGANRVGSRRTASLAAAFSLSERAASEYKDKVLEKLGVKKEEGIRADIADDRMRDVELNDVRLAGISDLETCYDIYSGIFFRSSVEDIKSCVNDFNRLMLSDGMATLADFYRMLDIPDVPVHSESVGWNNEEFLDVQFASTLLQGVRPVLTMNFRRNPEPDYDRFRRL